MKMRLHKLFAVFLLIYSSYASQIDPERRGASMPGKGVVVLASSYLLLVYQH